MLLVQDSLAEIMGLYSGPISDFVFLDMNFLKLNHEPAYFRKVEMVSTVLILVLNKLLLLQTPLIAVEFSYADDVLLRLLNAAILLPIRQLLLVHGITSFCFCFYLKSAL